MDLNVIIEDCGPRDSPQLVQQKLTKCKLLGYQTIALSVIIETGNDNNFKVPPPPSQDELTITQLKVYTRLTVRVNTDAQLYYLERKSKEAAQYDLIALEPNNAKILQYIVTGSAKLDILTFNLFEKVNHDLTKVKFRLLEDRGVCIEINYGQAQLGSALRRNIICNGQNLVEKTSKTLIFSSGISDIFRLRSPTDVKHLAVLFFLPTSKCHDSVFNNGRKAISHAKRRVEPTSSAIEKVVKNE